MQSENGSGIINAVLRSRYPMLDYGEKNNHRNW
jgi:hypothetical protein